MSFLYPLFLYAGLVALIPVVIHLFNFRRYKIVYFSDTRFLENIKSATHRRSQLKHLLLLALRILILVCLVIAFAGPIRNTASQPTQSSMQAPPIIYLDNSLSMQAGGLVGGLETAKSKILQITEAYPPNTDFIFITNDFEQKHNRTAKIETIKRFLQETELSPNVPSLSQIINKAKSNLSLAEIPDGLGKNIYLVSDFQKNICDFNNLTPDSTLNLNLVPIQSDNVNNIFIDSCVFDTPFRRASGQENLKIYIKNFSNNNLTNLPLKLIINGKQKAATTFDILAGERKELEIKYINTDKGIVCGNVETSDSPIDYDNKLYFSYKIEQEKKVGLIVGNAEKYFDAMFKNDSDFNLQRINENEINKINIDNFQTIILAQPKSISKNVASALQNFTALGGNLIFVPDFDGNIQDYNYLLNSLMCNAIISRDTVKCKIAKINTQSRLLKNAIKEIPENADLPVIKQHFNSMSNAYTNEEIILESSTYKKMLTSNNYRAGKVYIFYCPIDEKSGNIATHRLFVPLIYNAAAITDVKQQTYCTIGNNSPIDVKINEITDATRIIIKSQETGNEFIPRISTTDGSGNVKIFNENNINNPGFYYICADGNTIDAIAYNYNRAESELSFYTADDLQSQIENLNVCSVKTIDKHGEAFVHQVAQAANAIPLWKYFILVALFFAVGEVAVSRWL